jgi:hypothetical protein
LIAIWQYFTVFDIFYSNFVYFPVFSKLLQEKSGNPAGYQIWRLFASWVIIFSGKRLEKYKICPNFCANLFRQLML